MIQVVESLEIAIFDTPYMNGRAFKAYVVFYRICWLIMLLAMLCLMVEQLYTRVASFLENPLAVNIEIKYQDQVRFPSIVICNKNLYP